MYTYAELFAGAGGMSLGLEAGGFHAFAHAEIEPHARAVLRNRWPSVRLDGDVTQINGADYAGITLLSGGSPCQDLSVAGKRAGLIGSRSSLFHEQCRIWRESGAPYLLWENVLGALSSNNGRDFATVLSTIVGSTVHVPADGWRGGGGVVAGRDAVAAFRVLDLQHFGPPQRRVRVFILAARTGGVDPAEVLALSQGVCRHPSPREQSRQRTAASVGGGVEGGCLTPWDSESKRVFTDDAVFPTLYAGQNSGQQQQSVVALSISNGVPSLDDTMETLDTDGASTTAIGNQTRGVVLAFAENQQGQTRLADVTQALAGGGGKPGQGYAAVLCTTGHITHALTHERADASEDGTGRGTPIVSVFVDPDMESWKEARVIEPMCARDYKDAAALILPDVVGTLDFGGHGGSYNGQDAYSGRILPSSGRPRRLTPLECERLMSWPDRWTATGTKDDGTTYALSDTARYRLCGNGVGSVCAEGIARRLHDAITAADSTA